jgi:uncharacterized repeat protein (TIGR02543 family)
MNRCKIIVLLFVSVFFISGCSKPDETMFTVTFNSNGGNDIPEQTLNAGSYLKESTPINRGFIFAGWYSDEELQRRFNYTNAVNSDITLYAKWSANVLNGNVTFYSSNMSEIISFPHNMIFDDLGILFLSTEEGIYKITASGAVSSFVKGKYWGMSFDAKGDLYALKPENTYANIDKIDALGNVTPFFKVDFFASNLIFNRKNGSLFVNDFVKGNLKMIDALGNISQFATGYGSIQDFAMDPSGIFYFADHSSIAKFDLKGRNSGLAYLSSSIPMFLICDRKGNIYSGNMDGTICKITPTGAVVSFKLDGSLGGLRCMTIDKDANVYVVLSNQKPNYDSVSSILKITY